MTSHPSDSAGIRQAKNRRRFLKFLATSPLATPAPLEAWQSAAQAPANALELKTAKDAFSVMDFEAMARRVLPVAHYGYMASGVDDDLTLRANVEGYKKIALRPRRLVDVSKTDIKTTIFGATWDMPIFICPTGGQRMFHPDGELATARAAKAKNALQILSTVTSVSYEEVSQARTQPVWYQLYAPAKWEDDETLIKRVEAAGCPVLVLTIDLFGGRNTETYRRARRADTRDCSACHMGEPGTRLDDRPMFRGIEARINPSFADWNFVDRLKKATRMKLVLKGIESGDDARLAVEHGVDAVLVSNHGGRAAETLRGTIETLPEVVDAVRGRIPVFLYGGIRRGTDVYKALALGAAAVGIGRPYLWGLAAFGQAGVEQVLDILRAELTMTMRQMGTPTLAQITKSSLIMR
jgi:4-hydroxymandelate oxidase